MSNFGDLVKRLRKERSLTLEAVAKKIGSHKGYVSGIENDKVNPPSVKIIKKFAKLFSQDERTLVRIAWADKAPAIIREDAQRSDGARRTEGASPVDLSRVPLLNTVTTGYAADLAADGRVKPAVSATLGPPQVPGPPRVRRHGLRRFDGAAGRLRILARRRGPPDQGGEDPQRLDGLYHLQPAAEAPGDRPPGDAGAGRPYRAAAAQQGIPSNTMVR